MRLFGIFFAAVAIGCASESPTSADKARPGPTTGTPFILSAPRHAAGKRDPVVFLSMRPHSIEAETVVVNVRPRGTVLAAALTDGGLDPLEVTADVGDTLQMDVTVPGTSRLHYDVVVPASAPPSVLRMAPSDSRVPQDATIGVVFSEPMSPSSVTPGALALSTSSALVAGRVVFGDSTGLVLTFVPLTLLDAANTYSLSVASGLRNLAGVPLAAATLFHFTAQVSEQSADAAKALIGTWEVTSWRFTNTPESDRTWHDDRVPGLWPYSSYRVRLVVTPGDEVPIVWRWQESWIVGSDSGSAAVLGSALVGPHWFLGRTTQSPWYAIGTDCYYGDLCPLQDLFDFELHGDVLTMTRRAWLLYENEITGDQPTLETLTLVRRP